MKFEYINDHDDFSTLLRCEVSCFNAVVGSGKHGLDCEAKRSSSGEKNTHD